MLRIVRGCAGARLVPELKKPVEWTSEFAELTHRLKEIRIKITMLIGGPQTSKGGGAVRIEQA